MLRGYADSAASTGLGTRRPQAHPARRAVVAAALIATHAGRGAGGADAPPRTVPEWSESVDLPLASGLGSVLNQDDVHCSEGSGMTEHEGATRRRGGLVPLAVGHV